MESFCRLEDYSQNIPVPNKNYLYLTLKCITQKFLTTQKCSACSFCATQMGARRCFPRNADAEVRRHNLLFHQQNTASVSYCSICTTTYWWLNLTDTCIVKPVRNRGKWPFKAAGCTIQANLLWKWAVSLTKYCHLKAVGSLTVVIINTG